MTTRIKWHSFEMGAGVNADRAKRMDSDVRHTHAVDVTEQGVYKPLCRVKIQSLVIDWSLCKEGEKPTCPVCAKKIERMKP